MTIHPPHHIYRPRVWISRAVRAHQLNTKLQKPTTNHTITYSSLHFPLPNLNLKHHHAMPPSLAQNHTQIAFLIQKATMSVEARRLAVLCAHLNPTRLLPDPPSSPRVSLTGSACASDSDTQNHTLQNDCVFCKIIRDQSPAVKVHQFFFGENLEYWSTISIRQ